MSQVVYASQLEPSSATREARARRQLARQGSILQKSRSRSWSIDNQGGYMIVNANRNFVEAGERFDLALEDVERIAFAANN